MSSIDPKVLAAAKEAALKELGRGADETHAWLQDDPQCPLMDDEFNIVGTFHQVRFDGGFDLDRLVTAILDAAAAAAQ